jgi:hypothetical protein
MGATRRETMERKFSYRGNAFRLAANGAMLLLAGGLVLGCGAGEDFTTGADPRLRFASSITASPTGCGLTVPVVTGKDTTYVQGYNVSTTWQVTGTWKAVFVNVLPGKIAATTAADANQTKVSIFVDEKGVTQKCLFKAGDRAYAILSPDGTSPVNGDADATSTIVVGQ